MDYQNPRLIEHIENGGAGITITPNGMIQLIQGQSQTAIIHVKDVPATFGGHAIFNVQNALFAIASVHRYVSIEDLRAGLSTFTMNYTSTPGRVNIERVKGARVIIDYGHNPSALKAQAQLINGFYEDQAKSGRRAIVFGMPGDRPDSTIMDGARMVAGNYDRYFLKEDWKLRGRKSGEMVSILKTVLLKEGVSEDQIEVYSDGKTELDAIDGMYNWLETSDVVLLQADNILKVRNHLLVTLAHQSKAIVEPQSTSRPGSSLVDYASAAKEMDFVDEQSD